MPPLSYEKAILRSFVPTWRESLVLYLKNGSLDAKKSPHLAERLGGASSADSELHNGLIIVSSGIDLNRLLFYLLFYIANPLHVYECDGFTPEFKKNLTKPPALDEKMKKDYENLLEEGAGSPVCVEDGAKVAACGQRVKRTKFEVSETVKREFEPGPYESIEEDEPGSQGSLRIDDVYDCPSLAMRNSKLRLKSNAMYRKIFSICEPVRPARIWERSFLFSDVSVQSAVTMYTHLVFVLGLEQCDFNNYQDTYRGLLGRLFTSLGGDAVVEASEDKEHEDGSGGYIRLPKLEFVDGNVLSAARQQLYVSGGFFCINSRILLNDILSGKILPEIIGGVLVMNGHQILEDYNIAFVVRLLRMRNKVAFVKAVSNNVYSFRGNNLNFCLKNIFTKNVHIFPRCHQLIEGVLNDTQVQPLTFEVFLPLSDNATAVYKSILKIIWTVVESMKRLKYDIDMNKVVYTSYKGLIKLLNKQVNSANVYQIYLNSTSGSAPNANNSNNSTSYGINYYIDTLLKFRMLLDNLLYMDPVTFVEQLEKIKTDNSNWICTPNAIKLFKKSNERLFSGENENIELNVEKNLKYEYIKDVFQSQITNEQLVQMVKSNFKFHRSGPNWRLNRNSHRTGAGRRRNLSVDARRRCLIARESNHLSYLDAHFKNGKKLRRNILIVVENFYLVEYLTKYFKYDVHLNKLLYLLQLNMINDARNGASSAKTPVRTGGGSSFSSEYYSSINKDILSKNNVYSLYKQLVDTKTAFYVGSGSTISSDTQNSSSNALEALGEGLKLADGLIMLPNLEACLNRDSREVHLPDPDEEGRGVYDETADEQGGAALEQQEELVDYLDINVDFDDYVFNNISIIKSYSNVSTGKIDKYDRLLSTLFDLNPCIVVIYSPNVHVFRIVENYCALKFSRPARYRKRLNFLQVHVLSYRDCLETHRFTKALKSELDSWSYVQTQRSSLVVRMDEAILLNRSNLMGQVVVDTRELNSKLPFFLFNLGIQVVPTVLEIGDYLVTRDLCIERKSLSDLYMSLNSTRLAKQLSEMCSAYANPFLLIEFDENEKFHFSSVGDTRFGHNYMYTKLVIVCCNFPKLRLIWSSSPQESANIIKHLKVNRSEPDLISNEYLVKKFRNKSEKITAPGALEPGPEHETVGLRRPEFVKNRDALKILRNIPGVTSHNLAQILTKVNSLLHLSELSLSELCAFLPEHEARRIHDYFNMPINST